MAAGRSHRISPTEVIGPLPVAQNNCPATTFPRPRSTGENALHLPDGTIPGNFTVKYPSRVNLPRTNWTPGGVFHYGSTGGALTAAPGANNIRISLDWDDNDNSTRSNGQPTDVRR